MGNTFDTTAASAAPVTAGTLAYIRRLVVEQSGHYELVTDAEGGDYSDNGCDIHINAAQRWLDRVTEHQFQTSTPVLLNDTDTCWWSENHEDILVRATRRQIEIDLHRNDSGARGFEESLVPDLRMLYNQAIKAEVDADDQFDYTTTS